MLADYDYASFRFVSLTRRLGLGKLDWLNWTELNLYYKQKRNISNYKLQLYILLLVQYSTVVHYHSIQ